MSEIKVGDTVVLTAKVPDSDVYPFAVEGAEGTVIAIQPGREYPYQVVFHGEHAIDPRGLPTVLRDIALLFEQDEIELKVDTEDKEP